MAVWVSVAIGASCVAVLLGYLATPTAQDRAVGHLPTPASSLPLVGNTLDLMLRQRRRIYDWLAEQSRVHQGRPWRVRVLGRPPAVVVSCPEAFEDVLQTQFARFDKGAMVSAIVSDVLGSGIFGVDGERWTHQRKTASSLFTAHTVRDVMQPVVRERCAALVARLEACAASGTPILDAKRLLDVFTMDVFAKIGFGVDLRGVEGDGDRAFLEAFDRCSRRVVERFQQPMAVWKLMRWLSVGRERQHAKDMAVINGFALGVISRSMQAKTDSATSGSERTRRSCPQDLVSLFLDRPDAVDASGQHAPTDLALLRDLSINLLFAGRDTTSLTMAWFFVMMNRFPHVLRRIRAELAEKLPPRPNDEAPSADDVQRLVYLEAAIRESLRLNPVVAVTTRVATQDTTLYDGTLVREGTRVVLPHYAMARMPNVWGDDAERFDPDRWIDGESGKLLHVPPSKFSVFLAGPRMCLGMAFALVEMKTTLAAVLRRFDLTTVRDAAAFSYRPSMTLQIDGPLDVLVTPVQP